MLTLPDIHPTAVIDPAARLGAGVRIGPYACIEGAADVGAGCVLEAHSVLIGAVRLAPGVRVGHGSVLGGWPQDFSFKPETQSGVDVGEGSVIREHCTIHRGTAPGSVTRLGARCMLMANAHLGHNAQVGDHAVIANGALLGGYVELGERAFVGGGSVFHQFVRVGKGAMIQGLSAISQDVPPFTLAARLNLIFGLNVVGLRRAKFDAGERAEIKAAFKLLYASGLNVSQAVAAARERAWSGGAAEFWAFVAAPSKRGLCCRGTKTGLD